MNGTDKKDKEVKSKVGQKGDLAGKYEKKTNPTGTDEKQHGTVMIL